MVWGEGSGRNVRVTDTMVEQRYGRTHHFGDMKQLQVLMYNWTGGVAETTIRYEVHNDLDERMEL